MIKKLLNNGNEVSSMRFSLLLAVIGAFVLMMAVAAFIVISAIKGGSPEWASMGVFALGIAGILTGVGYNKAKQKEIELANEK
jgi:uncharacterized membrane protein YuzA (DUF378 family)